jgi:hypothetical protein
VTSDAYIGFFADFLKYKFIAAKRLEMRLQAQQGVKPRQGVLDLGRGGKIGGGEEKGSGAGGPAACFPARRPGRMTAATG